MRVPKDRRTHARLRAYKGGKVVFRKRFCTLDCVVRDISEHGARLQMVAPEFVPNSFILNIPKDGFEAEAVVKHRSNDEIGVELSPQH